MTKKKNNNSKKLTEASKKPEQELQEYQELLQCIIELSSDYYWEQDENHRFTKALLSAIDDQNSGAPHFIGKTLWELDMSPVEDDGSWEKYKAILETRQPFNNILFRYTDPYHNLHYARSSGRPVFDNEGEFKGYRGVGRDVTVEVLSDQLLHLEHTLIRLLANSKDISETLEVAIRVICKTEGWAGGNFWVLNEEEDVLHFKVGWYAEDNAAVKWFEEQLKDVKFTSGMGLPGLVWQTEKPIWTPDIKNDDRTLRKEIFERMGWNAVFLFPVTSGGELIGVLDFFASRIPEPDERLLQVMRVLGNEIDHYYKHVADLEKLRESEERFRSLTDLSSDWYWEQDSEFRFTRFEGRLTEHIGRIREYYIGKKVWETGVNLQGREDMDSMQSLFLSHESFRDVVMHRTFPNGTKRYFSVSGEPIFDDSGCFTGYRGLSRDVTESKRAEERIRYLATHDGMTDLPNREMFSQLLNLAIKAARRYEREFAVLFIDLDRFKQINDSLGHEGGDELLKVMSTRLKKCLRDSDVIARIGGDEFIVLLQDVGEEGQIAMVARNLLSAVVEPMHIFGQECRVTASIGICMYPRDADDEQSLIKKADIAMYLAKEKSRNNYQFFSKEIKSQSVEQLILENNLRNALHNNEFFLQYQAVVDLKTQTIRGVEALLRWENPDLGQIQPGRFLRLAEENGLIVPIGRWVLSTACNQNMAWQRQGLSPINIAVNISRRQFFDHNFINDIANVLVETNMAPELLELEVTESTIMHNAGQAVEVLSDLKKLRVRIAIDDFGAGYSSLAQLKRYHIDTIKVDRSLISKISMNKEDRAITEAIIAMGKILSLTIVAEGVETEEQQIFLNHHACEEMQGYYFSEPLCCDEFTELLQNHKTYSNVGQQQTLV